MIVGVIADFKVLVGRITHDVRSITSLGALLTGDFGRYANGNVSSALTTSKNARDASATMADLIAKNTDNRAAVDAAMDTLVSAAANLDASSSAAFTAAVQGVMDALVAGIADPGNAIALLGPLASYTPTTFGGAGAIGGGSWGGAGRHKRTATPGGTGLYRSGGGRLCADLLRRGH